MVFFFLVLTLWSFCIWYVFDTAEQFGCLHQPKCVAVLNTNQIHKIHIVVFTELLTDKELCKWNMPPGARVTKTKTIPSEFLVFTLEEESEFLKLTAGN